MLNYHSISNISSPKEQNSNSQCSQEEQQRFHDCNRSQTIPKNITLNSIML